MIKTSLIANSASLGLNWIYSMPYLKRITKDKDPVFWQIDPEVYRKSRKGFFAYPHHQVGDVSFQGSLLLLLYKKLKNDPDYSPEQWREDVYDYIKPGGIYEGWVEVYGLDLVAKVLDERMNHKDPVTYTDYDDDQLVGFLPYLGFKALNLDLKRSLDFVRVLSVNQDYKKLTDMFDFIYEESSDKQSMKKAIINAIHLAPEQYHHDLDKATTMEDTDTFIREHSGIACHIGHSVPLIVHLLYHGSSYEELVRKNTIIGGASSDRGLMLGFIMGKFSKIPEEWIEIFLKRTAL